MGIALSVLATISLLIVGGTLVQWGASALRNRQMVLRMYYEPKTAAGARRFINLWTAFTLAGGVSMIVAAALVWYRPVIATWLGLWPAGAMLAAWMMNRGKVTVVSRLSVSDDCRP